MSRRIIFRPEADVDLVKALRWFSTVDGQATMRFVKEVEKTIAYIS